MEGFPSQLYGPWDNLNLSKMKKLETYQKFHKFWNRDRMLEKCWVNLKRLIPEHLTNVHPDTKSIIDISCGNGAVLELMRSFNYDIFGIDYYFGGRSFEDYREFLISQNIPFLEHNCGTFPYPIEDKSFDILTCIGAITFYAHNTEEVEERWPKVLDEFARITRQIIAVTANGGVRFDAGEKILDSWSHPDFELVSKKKTRYIWKRI